MAESKMSHNYHVWLVKELFVSTVPFTRGGGGYYDLVIVMLYVQRYVLFMQ